MNKLMLGALIVAGSMTMFSCNDEWDDHYSELPASATGGSIWETLNSNPEFSEFTKILKENGYDETLSGKRTPRIYTVFAPTNEAMQSYTETSNVDDQFIKNHIAYFYRNVSSVNDTTITMLNDKVMRLQGNWFGDKQNPNSEIELLNIPCQNGLVQGISDIVPYKKNIWEYLGESNGKMKDYLYSFNRILLNYNESTEGPINSDGQTVFLDSVTFLYNQMWSTVGYLNNEDSTYVSFILDDTAWEEGWNKIEKSYMYHKAQGEFFEQGTDSLLRKKDADIKRALIRYNSFRKSAFDRAMSNQDPNKEMITSTGGRYANVPIDVVKKWSESPLTQEMQASNGVAYLTSTFAYEAPDAWQDTIKVEAEGNMLISVGGSMTISRPRLVTDTLSISYLSTDYDPNSDKKYEVSNGGYFMVQRSYAFSAQATYAIPNTLSGDYDLWVTFIPGLVVGGVTPLPSSANVTINYARMDGDIIYKNERPITSRNFDIDPLAVTRVKVAELPTLDICWESFLDGLPYPTDGTSGDYFAEKFGIKVTIKNAVNVFDETGDRNLYIDCIELVPRPKK